MSFFDFMRVRVIRLYPLYLAGLVLAASMALIVAVKGWEPFAPWQVFSALAFALFLIPCPPGLSLWPNAPFPLNPPSWSLFFELVINAVMALTARWLTPAVCLVFMGVGAGGLTLATFQGWDLGGHAWSNIGGGLMRVTFSFFAGVWLYQMRERWTVPVLPIWAAFGLLFAAMAMPVPEGWRAYWDLVAVLFVFPLLVAMSAETRVRGAVLKACAFVGMVSYGVYILHVPLVAWVRLTLQHFGVYDVMPGVALVGVVAIVAVVTAAILHAVYDVPMRRLLTRMSRRGSREKAGPATTS